MEIDEGCGGEPGSLGFGYSAAAIVVCPWAFDERGSFGKRDDCDFCFLWGEKLQGTA
jgi:hypothetical protein